MKLYQGEQDLELKSALLTHQRRAKLQWYNESLRGYAESMGQLLDKMECLMDAIRRFNQERIKEMEREPDA